MRIFKHNNISNQKGMVSFITVIFLASILLAITIGFTRIMISNNRQSLDGQLNTQAFYAAESGINDFLYKYREILNIANQAERVAALADLETKYGLYRPCNDIIDYLSLQTDSVLDSNTPVKYSCLLVDNSVKHIFVDVDINHGKMYQIEGDDNAAITQIGVAWGKKEETGVRNSTQLVKQSDWSPDLLDPVPAMLRVTLYATKNGFDRANLITNQVNYYLVPNNHGSDPSKFKIQNLNDGDILAVNCNESAEDYKCAVIFETAGSMFNGLGLSKDETFIRVRPIYKSTSVKIDLPKKNNPVGEEDYRELVNAQFVIDVTGRASDVFKRIQVRKDASYDYYYPEFVTKTANNICKQYAFWSPNSVSDESGQCPL